MENSTLPGTLYDWNRRISKSINAHYDLARFYRKLNNSFGIPTVVLATTITALSFAFIGVAMPKWMQIFIGFMGLTQVVIAALHTWFNYGERADKHKNAAASYASVRRKIEILQVMEVSNPRETLDAIMDELDRISKSVPEPDGKIWTKTQEAYGGHGTVDGKILSPKKDSISSHQ